MSKAGGWRRLAELLADDEAVVQRVFAAADSDGDPWDALLDGLDDEGALAYLRATDTGVELVDALMGLPKVLAVQPDLDAASDADDLANAAALAGAVLEQNHLNLVLLVENEESWPLVVVSEDRVDEAVALAATLGREARQVG